MSSEIVVRDHYVQQPRQLHYLPYQQHLAPYHGYQGISGASHAESMIHQQAHHGYQSNPGTSHAQTTYQHPRLSMASVSNLGVAHYRVCPDILVVEQSTDVSSKRPTVFTWRRNGAVDDNKNNTITETTDMDQSWLSTDLTLPFPFVDPSVLVNPFSITPPSSFADPSTLPIHTSFTSSNGCALSTCNTY